MSKIINLNVRLEFSDSINADNDIQTVAKNVLEGLRRQIDSGDGIAPEDLDVLTDTITVSDITDRFVLRYDFRIVTDSQIQNFLNSYGTEIKPNEDLDYVELMMDNHIAISYDNVNYYVKKDNILYSDNDEEILNHLRTNYSY